MRFNIEDYDDTYVMHCENEEEAEVFCAFLDARGYRWRSGNRYTDPGTKGYWNRYKCFRFKMGTISPLSYYEEQCCTILEFNEFDWSDEGELPENAMSFDELMNM